MTIFIKKKWAARGELGRKTPRDRNPPKKEHSHHHREKDASHGLPLELKGPAVLPVSKGGSVFFLVKE